MGKRRKKPVIAHDPYDDKPSYAADPVTLDTVPVRASQRSANAGGQGEAGAARVQDVLAPQALAQLQALRQRMEAEQAAEAAGKAKRGQGQRGRSQLAGKPAAAGTRADRHAEDEVKEPTFAELFDPKSSDDEPSFEELLNTSSLDWRKFK
jgi:hypothetical protein